MQKKGIENLEFVQGVNLEFIDSVKNNGTRYLLIFDVSCEEICNCKAFVDNATAVRHDGALFTLSTTCFIKANLGYTLSSRTRILFFSSLPGM